MPLFKVDSEIDFLLSLGEFTRQFVVLRCCRQPQDEEQGGHDDFLHKDYVFWN